MLILCSKMLGINVDQVINNMYVYLYKCTCCVYTYMNTDA